MDVLNVGFNLPVSGPLYPDPPYYYRGAKIVLGVYEADATRVSRHLPPGVTVLEDPAVCIAWLHLSLHHLRYLQRGDSPRKNQLRG